MALWPALKRKKPRDIAVCRAFVAAATFAPVVTVHARRIW